MRMSSLNTYRTQIRQVACSLDGKLLYTAKGKTLELYDLRAPSGDPKIRRKLKAPGEITGIVCGVSAGPVLTVRGRGCMTIMRFQRDCLKAVAELPEGLVDILENAEGIFALMGPGNVEPPRILQLDPRSGDVLAARPAPKDATRLGAASGAAVLAIASRRRQIHRVSFDDRCPSTMPEPDPERTNPDKPNGRSGCCCDPRDPGPQGGGRRLPPRTPPADHCDDGDDGVDDGCRFYTAAGWSIICVDRCRPERKPCQRALHSRVEQLQLVGGTLFATTRQGRSIEALDPGTLAVLGQYATPAPGSFVLAAPAAGAMIALAPDLSLFTTIPVANPTAQLDLQSALSERVFHGTDLQGESIGPQFALESRSVLVIPTVDPTQNYDGPSDGSTYKSAIETLLEPAGSSAAADAPIGKIRRYYDEVSNEQQQLDFTVFGADTANLYSGPPIEIANAIDSYFNGPFISGGMVSLTGIGPSPARVSLRGNETRTITAITSVGEEANGANQFEFTLEFAAAIMTFDLGNSNAIEIEQTGPSWTIEYTDSSGVTRNLVLDPSVLQNDVSLVFDTNGGNFQAEVNELSLAFAAMISPSPVASDFNSIEVFWGKRPGEGLGKLYMLLRFSTGGDVPYVTDFGSEAMRESFLGVDGDDLNVYLGSAEFDLTAPADDIEDVEKDFGSYLTKVIDLAEIRGTPYSDVRDPILGVASVDAGGSNAEIALATFLKLSETYGESPANILPEAGSGADPLDLANGFIEPGSTFPRDDRLKMIDYDAFFQMFYGRLVQAVSGDLGGSPAGGWDALKDFLKSFDTVYLFPVDPPPPAYPGAWSVDHPVQPGLRAFVLTLSESTIDPNGVGEPVRPKWGMNFQSFDPVIDSDSTRSPMEADTQTLAHELGHTLGLSDQYASTTFDPGLDYIGGLDPMGGSSSNWAHFCAYHKLALGWFGEDDRILLSPPPEEVTETTHVVLVPTEWWQSNLADAARAAVGVADDIPVAAAAICDLGNNGGLLNVIEARAPGPEFSQSLDSGSNPGRVTVMNILDYATGGRYGKIIADADTIPPDVIDNFFRYRRRLHRLARTLQETDIFDFANAPGFPFDGLRLEVVNEDSITVNGTPVPVFHCAITWTGGQAADVGFADNDQEWQSTDIAIDYIGNDPDNEEFGEDTWPDGEPLGVGNKIVIPSSGAEPHRVRVRVRNFGPKTARNVAVSLYLRDPGGGGEMNGEEPYATDIIAELPPVSESGPVDLHFPWDVPADQELHVCWRAEIDSFEIGTGAGAQVVVTDASPVNNWVQQNIFEADVTYASPPEPLLNRFSVGNDGPFRETARLVPVGLPPGVTLTVRPKKLRIPPFGKRTFSLRFDFDEELTEDPCRRQMDVLLHCLRTVDHDEELWGASLFKIHLRRKTTPAIQGNWYSNNLYLTGQMDPAIGVGSISIRLDFNNGEPATWLQTTLDPGGVFEAEFDTTGIAHESLVLAAAHYRGTSVFAPSVSSVAEIYRTLPPA